MTTQHFCLPDVGEGLTDADIVTWHVIEGDEVRINDVVVEIETAKSLVELPSPFAGTVAKILAAEGSTVHVGTPILAVRTDADADTSGSEPPWAGTGTPAGAAPRVEGTDATGDEDPSSEPAPSVLVGYGPSKDGSGRRRRRAPVHSGSDRAGTPGPSREPVTDQETASGTGPTSRAKPPVRKLANDLGVDLAAVTPTGPDHTVTRTDVLGHADAATVRPTSSPAGPTQTASPHTPVVDGGTRIQIKGVRKAMAAAMSASVFTAPHVTEFITVDVTRSVRLVKKLKEDSIFEGSRVTMLLVVARALLATVGEFPHINASWDGDTDEIVVYDDVNLGIASATPRGLVVPNIKNAAQMPLPVLARALTDLIHTARDGRSTPEDMSRGTITITNIGVFGVDTGTPILNPGEAAILCVGAVRRTPAEHKGKIRLRWTAQLSLSFDHRLVDGELGSRVLARVARILEDPTWELLLS